MNKYVKLKDGNLEFAPKNKGNILNYDKNEQLLLADGYKLYVPAGEYPGHLRYEISYEEHETTINEVVTVTQTEEEYQKEKKQERIEHIKSLQCTKRVFALMLQELGISYTQLKDLINSNEQAQLEWELCVELLRSNPMLDLMASQLGITSEQLDKLFLYANGEITIEEFKS